MDKQNTNTNTEYFLAKDVYSAFASIPLAEGGDEAKSSEAKGGSETSNLELSDFGTLCKACPLCHIVTAKMELEEARKKLAEAERKSAYWREANEALKKEAKEAGMDV